MPRRQFIADLQFALQDHLPPTVQNLRAGEDDGQIVFDLTTTDCNGAVRVERITALVPDLDQYPKSHEYMIFATDDASSEVSQAIDSIRVQKGKTIFEIVDIIATTISNFTLDRDGDTPMIDSEFGETSSVNEESRESGDEDEDEDDIYDSDHDAFDLSDNMHPHPLDSTQQLFTQYIGTSNQQFRERIRADLRLTRDSGFKVGILGDILRGTNGYVTVAIRISKLGISEEALEAWQTSPQDYLILILNYPYGYKTIDQLLEYNSARLATSIGMRVVASKHYKPCLKEAIDAFAVAKIHGVEGKKFCETDTGPEPFADHRIRETFISGPLETLLEQRFVSILGLRKSGMGWNSAEELYISQIKSTQHEARNSSWDEHAPDTINPALPDILNADHLRSRMPDRSFPLVTMQFLLRHFAQCTKFCLVCYRRLDDDVEAIKPYVCDSGLCLYQYMTLGFGPKIEHEILAQPYVVDLLVSFLYNSAAMGRLQEFPDGLSIMVPPNDLQTCSLPNPPIIRAHNFHQTTTAHRPQTPEHAAKPKVPLPIYEVSIDVDRRELLFSDKTAVCPVRSGDWIVVKPSLLEHGPELHCRIADASWFPVVFLNHIISWRDQTPVNPFASITLPYAVPMGKQKTTPSQPSAAPQWVPTAFQVYAQNFNDLDNTEKSLAITRVLNTLPDVMEMREYLSQDPRNELKGWTDRISPAALSILRWCIASSRSCIMQVDGDKEGASVSSRKRERLTGMRDYMQFRFAMGAPDKEQRFIEAVRGASHRLHPEYPTIFAWHGSPLYNWHGIIREGLHYKNFAHGRAYGNGVYHARDAHTSTGYSGMSGGYAYGGGTTCPSKWTNSLLNITTAVALNEIVNAPSEFTTQAPYYVVQHINWIQVRWLFCQVTPDEKSNIKIGEDMMPTEIYPQDPRHIPKGTTDNIVIPASAFKTRKFKVTPYERGEPSMPKKKARMGKSPESEATQNGGTVALEILDNSDAESVRTTESDLEVLYGGEIEEDPDNKTVPLVLPGPPTDFVPGTLDFSTLPLMPLPIYAVSGTTKRLLRDLQSIKKTQDTTPLAELGWSIDVSKISNVYQWIVELHSFHTFSINNAPLPLVADMRAQNLTSIVLELRFNKDFPYTPPYVRVVRPRFLSFNQGGGGHVVLGGAMCMELLTNTGWSSVSSLESVLMQIRLAIASEPFARLDPYSKRDYGIFEAAEGYIRACRTHGWEVPPGFRELAYGVPEERGKGLAGLAGPATPAGRA